METIVKLVYLLDGKEQTVYYNGDGELSIGNNRASILVHPSCASRRQICLCSEGGTFYARACGQAKSEIISKERTVSLSKTNMPLCSGDVLVCSPTVKFTIKLIQRKQDQAPAPANTAAAKPATSSQKEPSTPAPKTSSATKEPPAAPAKDRTKSRYPESFYKKARAMKLPELIMHKSILKKLRTWPRKGRYNLAVLFHIPTSKDTAREQMEINDIIFCLAAMGFNRIEIIQGATYHKCKLVMDAKIAQIRQDGIKVHSLCVLVASHGDNSSASRLNILLHDGSSLDSSQLNRWAFDLRAKHTLIIALTCHAENITHDSPWPGTTSGGFIWASSSQKTAAFEHFDISYSNGLEQLIKFDTFIRALFELLFCVENLIELENNILMRGFCSLWEAAHSIATGGKSSFGFQPCGNGNEIPMKLLPYIERLQLLRRGVVVYYAHVNAKNQVSWTPQRVKGRLCGGRTWITETIQKQIDARAPLEEVDSSSDFDSEDEEADTRGFNNSDDEESNPSTSEDQEHERNVTSDLDDKSASSPDELVAESINHPSSPATTTELTQNPTKITASAAILALTGIIVTLDGLSLEDRRKEEQKIIRVYNARTQSTCAKKICACGKRLVGFKRNATQEDLAQFSSMDLATYFMPVTRITAASSCNAECRRK